MRDVYIFSRPRSLSKVFSCTSSCGIKIKLHKLSALEGTMAKRGWWGTSLYKLWIRIHGCATDYLEECHEKFSQPCADIDPIIPLRSSQSLDLVLNGLPSCRSGTLMTGSPPCGGSRFPVSGFKSPLNGRHKRSKEDTESMLVGHLLTVLLHGVLVCLFVF